MGAVAASGKESSQCFWSPRTPPYPCLGLPLAQPPSPLCSTPCGPQPPPLCGHQVGRPPCLDCRWEVHGVQAQNLGCSFPDLLCLPSSCPGKMGSSARGPAPSPYWEPSCRPGGWSLCWGLWFHGVPCAWASLGEGAGGPPSPREGRPRLLARPQLAVADTGRRRWALDDSASVPSLPSLPWSCPLSTGPTSAWRASV